MLHPLNASVDRDQRRLRGPVQERQEYPLRRRILPSRHLDVCRSCHRGGYPQPLQ